MCCRDARRGTRPRDRASNWRSHRRGPAALHLAGVNADSKLDPEASYRVAHRDGTSNGATGTSKGCEEPSPVVFTSLLEAIELRRMRRLCSASTCFQAASPSFVAVSVESTMSDIRSVVTRRSCSPGTPSAPMLPSTSTTTTGSSPTTQTSWPGGTFMTSPGPNSALSPSSSRRGTSLDHQLEMVDLARVVPWIGRSDVDHGSRLQDAAAHRHGPEVHQVDDPVGEPAYVIRCAKPSPDGSAGT